MNYVIFFFFLKNQEKLQKSNRPTRNIWIDEEEEEAEDRGDIVVDPLKSSTNEPVVFMDSPGSFWCHAVIKKKHWNNVTRSLIAFKTNWDTNYNDVMI